MTEADITALFHKIAGVHADSIQAGIDELRQLMIDKLAENMDDPNCRPFTEGYMEALEAAEQLIRVGT